MFKWPENPSPRAPVHEIADFAELVCWQQGGTSVTQLVQLLGRLEDNDYSGGVPEEGELPGLLGDVYEEIELRRKACSDGYPLSIDEAGHTLHLSQDASMSKYIIYKYLLLATRLNMSNDRVHGGIDGTLLLEELAAQVARGYLGVRAESIVFGTAEGTTGFSDKINDLCQKLEEGGEFVNPGGGPLLQRDDKLDVVAWKPFSDRREGKLIAFGQCKTGTNWKDHLTQLRPDAFCSNWF